MEINIQTILGISLVMLPFVGITTAMVVLGGWRLMLCVWGLTAAIFACVSAGAFLLSK